MLLYKQLWAADITYSKQDTVQINYQIFSSKIDSNLNNNPTTSPNAWKRVTVMQVLANIIQNEMNLADGVVWTYNQEYNIPPTEGLKIVIQETASEAWRTSKSFNQQLPDVPRGEVSTLTKEEYLINIMSRNDEAHQRKEEVALALGSYFAESQMQSYNFNISQMGNLMNISEAEGGSMLTRFAFRVVVLTKYTQIKNIPVYTEFSDSIIND